MQQISVRARTPAGPATVYALLRDGASWPRWSPLGSFELARPGEPDREGLGALRVFRTGRTRTCEEVIALEPDRRFGYALRSGLPLRDYRAYVDLTPAAGGTDIHWHSTFTGKIPGAGWFYRLVLTRFITRVVAGLVTETTRVG